VAFVSLVLAFIPLAACDTPSARVDHSPPAAAATTVWRSVGTWSGRGNRQTESFDVTTGALRLRWEARGATGSGEGRFRVTLHSSISGRPLQVFVDHAGAGGDTAYAEDEPRTSYLVIESEQVEWSAVLDEAIGTTRGAASGTGPPAGR
jgi:hypothetical protein